MTEQEHIKCDLPLKLLLRRGDILNSNLNVSETLLQKYINAGVITPIYAPGAKQARYDRNQVLHALRTSYQ